MKQLTSMVLAGIIGGLITLGGFYLVSPQTPAQTVKLVNQPTQKYAQLAADRIQTVPFDFTAAAEKTTPAVVHITSKQTVKEEVKRQQSPFDFFFGPMEGTPNKVQVLGSLLTTRVLLLPIIMWLILQTKSR